MQQSIQPIDQTLRRARRPLRVLQYGEGNFLRGFADEMIDAANAAGVFDGGVAVVKPRAGGGKSLDALRAQHGVYSVLLRGMENGAATARRRVVTAIERALDPGADYEEYMALAREPALRFVVSNTTEAGIVFDAADRFDARPPRSFPGKLTQFLHARFQAFGGDAEKGLIVLPTELIEDNGGALLSCVARLSRLWGLGEAFERWTRDACVFCSTLVDRIVAGYPHEEIESIERESGCRDRLLVAAEPYGLWVIACADPRAAEREFPLDRAGLPVVFTRDARPYRARKVRILNGAHTCLAPAAWLAGLDTVGECCADPDARAYLERAVFGEIVPATPAPDALPFAESVVERFQNPFLRHSLLSIAMNSVSKWRARVLPTLLDAVSAGGEPPRALCFSLAALAAFYTSGPVRDGVPCAARPAPDGQTIHPLQDEERALGFFAAARELGERELTARLAARADFWGQDLGEIPGLCAQTALFLGAIRARGAREAMRAIV